MREYPLCLHPHIMLQNTICFHLHLMTWDGSGFNLLIMICCHLLNLRGSQHEVLLDLTETDIS